MNTILTAGKPPDSGSGSRRRPVVPLGKLIPVFLTVGPVLLWLLIFVLAPTAYIFIISFFQKGNFGGVVPVFTLENYRMLFSPLYLRIFLVSGIIALATTVLCLILGYPFAYIISMADKKMKNTLMLLIMLPFWTNSLIRTYGWITLLRTDGVFNKILLSTRLITRPAQLLYNNGAIMLGMVYTLFPFMVLPLYSSLEKLDASLLEAAGDLGANPAHAFVRVTLPLTGPGIFAGSIQVFIPTLGYFFITDLMGGGKIMMVGNLINNQFLSARNWPFGSALSIVLILFTILLMGLYRLAGGDMEDMA